MTTGEVAWFVLSKEFTDYCYHKHFISDKHDRDNIGNLVYFKISLEKIKR